jgi:hypothetical protein
MPPLSLPRFFFVSCKRKRSWTWHTISFYVMFFFKLYKLYLYRPPSYSLFWQHFGWILFHKNDKNFKSNFIRIINVNKTNSSLSLVALWVVCLTLDSYFAGSSLHLLVQWVWRKKTSSLCSSYRLFLCKVYVKVTC